MQITPTTNHGKPRWRVNVQRGTYRKRMFFTSYADAFAFAQATGGQFTVAEVPPPPAPLPPPPRRPAPAPRPPAPPKRPRKSALEAFMDGED